MPASKAAERVLEALRVVLETAPAAFVERNSVLPEMVPAGGLIILRDGDPGEPEQALGGFGDTYYQHAVKIEVYVEEGEEQSGTPPSMTSCSRLALRSSRSDPRRARLRPGLRPTGTGRRGGRGGRRSRARRSPPPSTMRRMHRSLEDRSVAPISTACQKISRGRPTIPATDRCRAGGAPLV
jgi:hypothetical protein